MKTNLDHRQDHLCVLFETERQDPPDAASGLRAWYPIYRADRAEVSSLIGRPLSRTDADEGLFVDEDGNAYQLADRGQTAPLEIETPPASAETGSADNRTGAAEPQLKPALRAKRSARWSQAHRAKRPEGIERGARAGRDPAEPRSDSPTREPDGDRHQAVTAEPGAPLTLRQKLAVVRRRIAYIQKRGRNELHDYTYVTAADIAGAVGDLFAELGVIVVPKLESITHEALRGGPERVARVIMNYSFVDVDTGEGNHYAGRGRRPRRGRQGALQGDDRCAQVCAVAVLPARDRR